MIVRILGQGRYDVPEADLPAIEQLDAQLSDALDRTDEAEFVSAPWPTSSGRSATPAPSCRPTTSRPPALVVPHAGVHPGRGPGTPGRRSPDRGSRPRRARPGLSVGAGLGRRHELHRSRRAPRFERAEGPGHDAVGGRSASATPDRTPPVGVGLCQPKMPAMHGVLTITAWSGSSPAASTEAPWTPPRSSRSTFMRCSASAFGSVGLGHDPPRGEQRGAGHARRPTTPWRSARPDARSRGRRPDGRRPTPPGSGRRPRPTRRRHHSAAPLPRAPRWWRVEEDERRRHDRAVHVAERSPAARYVEVDAVEPELCPRS